VVWRRAQSPGIRAWHGFLDSSGRFFRNPSRQRTFTLKLTRSRDGENGFNGRGCRESQSRRQALTQADHGWDVHRDPAERRIMRWASANVALAVPGFRRAMRSFISPGDKSDLASTAAAVAPRGGTDVHDREPKVNHRFRNPTALRAAHGRGRSKKRRREEGESGPSS